MENIKVFLRIRAQHEKEKSVNPPVIIRPASKTDLIVQPNIAQNSSTELRFEFNEIFNETAKQCDIYNAISAPILKDVILGYNCTLYSYGAKGTGKNYTMIGDRNAILSATTLSSPFSPKTLQMNDPHTFGLIPRTILNLFETLKYSALSYSVRVSYLEIFNDDLIDLLQGNDNSIAGCALKIYENNKNQVFVNGLTETVARTAAEALAALKTGNDRLSSHIHSSKSHTIFTLNVQLKEKPKSCDTDNSLIKFSRLNFVQLTSTENATSKSLAKTVQSLASLNRVIQALIDKQNHIPYRDSKLTRIMQESLGGNAKTAVIALIAPESGAIEETIQTLENMSRIKVIQNQPRINERMNKHIMLNDVAKEITQLKRDIEANKNKDGILLSLDEYESRRNELETSRNDLRRTHFELEALNESFNELNNNYADADSDLAVLSKKIALLRRIKAVQDEKLNVISTINKQREEWIAKHVVTEMELTQQSNQLMNTVETASDDASKLCESIERRKAVEESLEDMRDNFVSDMQEQLKNMSKYIVNNTKVFYDLVDVHKTSQEKFHRLTTSMLELFRTNTLLLDQKSDKSFKDGEIRLGSVVETTINDCTGREIVNQNSMPPQPIPFEHFLSICGKHFDATEKAYETFKTMLIKRSKTVDMFVVDIEKRIKGFYENMIEQMQSHHLTLEQTYKLNEQITDKMEAIYNHMQSLVNKVKENDAQLKSAMDPTLDNAQQRYLKSNQELMNVIRSHAAVMNDRKLNFEQEKFANNCKSAMNAVIKSIQENVSEEKIAQQNISTNNNITSKAAADHAALVQSNVLEKIPVFANELTTKLLSDFENGNACNSNEHDEKCGLVQDIVEANQKFVKEIDNGIDACVKNVKYFCHMDFCQYPSGETPVKRDYKTNVSLAATTPYDELKRKFRAKFAQSQDEDLNNYTFLGE